VLFSSLKCNQENEIFGIATNSIGGSAMTPITNVNTQNNLYQPLTGRICNERDPGYEIALKKGALKRLSGVKKWDLLICLEGEIWVTQEHDLKDYVLCPGDELFITLPGIVVIQALRDARVEVTSYLKGTSYSGKYPVFH
jgi:Protein of unknown function (DUF2917)